MIGRDDAIDVLRELVRDVAAGRGRSLWVEGEPGIGKTALLAAGLDQAEAAGCQVYGARADETSELFPLRVLLDALRVGPATTEPARAELADWLWGSRAGGAGQGDPVAAAAEMLLILVDRLCAAGPVVLVVDDIQWAAGPSLALWGRLSQAAAQVPLLLVAAARPVPHRAEVDRLRQQLIDSGSVDLVLGPLSSDQVGALVQRLTGASPGTALLHLVDQAGGNPLYVRQLVGALEDERRLDRTDGVIEPAGSPASAPPSLMEAISRRLSFLSDTTSRALRTATVLGNAFRLDHLGLLLERSPAALAGVVEEAVRAGVLAESGAALAFRHGLIHQSLYESMPAALRQGLHRQAAQSLAAAGEPVETVAEQVLAAPDTFGHWTVDWLVAAAPQLASRAPQAAVSLLERVRSLVDPQDPRGIALDVSLVDACMQLARYEDVERITVPMLAAAQDPELVGRMSWARAWALRARGRSDDGLDVCTRALTKHTLAPRWNARLLALKAMMLRTTAHHDQALSTAQLAEAEGERAGDRIAMAWALFVASLAVGEFQNDPGAALTGLERAAALVGDDLGAMDLRLLIQSNRATGLWMLGQPDEAMRWMGEALALAERAGTPHRLAALRVQTAEFYFLAGRWDDALPELEAASGALPVHSPIDIMHRGLGALIGVHRNDSVLIGRYLSEEEDEVSASAERMADALRGARALMLVAEGRPADAQTTLLRFLDPASNLSFPQLTTYKCVWMTSATRLALELHDRPTAEACSAACSAEAVRQPLPVIVAAAAHCRGLVDADPDLIMSAAAGFGSTANPQFRASALEDAAVLFAGADQAAAARAALDQALAIYALLDAHWDLRRAEARLRHLGLRRGARGPNRRSTVGWKALTPAEARVAKLVAQGKSNPDIATELYLSRNTVQTHVAHIFVKLGCRSRTEITTHLPAAAS